MKGSVATAAIVDTANSSAAYPTSFLNFTANIVVIAAVDAADASNDKIFRSLDTGTNRRTANMTSGTNRSLKAVMI